MGTSANESKEGIEKDCGRLRKSESFTNTPPQPRRGGATVADWRAGVVLVKVAKRPYRYSRSVPIDEGALRGNL